VRSPVSRHSIWQVGVDAVLVAAAWWLAWSLRFEHRPVYYDRYLDWSIVALVVAIKLPVFALSGFYNRWWRYVSTRDMWVAFRGVVLASVAVFLVFTLFEVHRVNVPRGVWFIDLLVCMAFVAGSRLLARTIIERPLPGRIVTRGKEAVIVGAGDAGQLVVKEMQRSPALGYTAIGLLDDDPRKRNLRLHGVRVLGTTADLDHVIRDRRPDEVLIAIPSASGQLRARIVETARALDQRAREEARARHEREAEQEIDEPDAARHRDAMDVEEGEDEEDRDRPEHDAPEHGPHVAGRDVAPPAVVEARQREDGQLHGDDEEDDRPVEVAVVVDRAALVEAEAPGEPPRARDDRRVDGDLPDRVPVDRAADHQARTATPAAARTVETTRAWRSTSIPPHIGSARFSAAARSVSGNEPGR